MSAFTFEKFWRQYFCTGGRNAPIIYLIKVEIQASKYTLLQVKVQKYYQQSFKK